MVKSILVFILFFNIGWAGSHFAVNFSLVDSETDIDIDVASIFPSFGEDSYYVGLSGLWIGEDPVTHDSLYQLYAVKLFLSTIVPPFEELKVELGVKTVYTQKNGVTYMAFPIGGNFLYRFPRQNIHPIIHGSLFYGPAILSVKPAKDYYEYRIGAGFEMDNIRQFIESGLGRQLASFHLLFEYCSIHTNFETVDWHLRDTFYLGVKVSF